jgi:hypothetical protein
MGKMSRAAYLATGRVLEALATLVSGENPDGTAFTMPGLPASGSATAANSTSFVMATDANDSAIITATSPRRHSRMTTLARSRHAQRRARMSIAHEPAP